MLDLFRTLPGLMQEIDGSEALREAFVFASWRRIAGTELSSHTVPTKLENARLTVTVSNLMWRRQLQDLSGQMLFKLNAALGRPLVSYIEFEIDEAFVREKTGGNEPDLEFEREARNAVTPELFEAAGKIEDVELRKQFLLAAGRCLVRRERAKRV